MKTFILSLLFFSISIHARSWSDLDDGEPEIYGREREEKLPVRMFFVQKEKWAGHESMHILWLYGYTDYPKYKSSRLLPFYYRLTSKIDNRDLFLSPVYHSEIDVDARDRSILWLYYWGADAKDLRNYSLLFPIYYKSSWQSDYSLLLSPLYYYSRSAGGSPAVADVNFGAPIVPLVLYSSGEDKFDLTLFYLFRHRKTKNEVITHTLPLYYYARSANTVTFFSLLYFSRDSDAYSFNMLIPLYLNHTTKNSAFHLNLTGVSLSEEKTNALPIGGEIREDKLIVDWDLGWFYNLFRVASRKSFNLAPSTLVAEVTADAAEKPKLLQKRERSRADSQEFFGLYLLFGLFAHEKADHYRHFRLLPLNWLTWNTQSEHGVQAVVPFYVRYADETSRYLVVFPIYGNQQKLGIGEPVCNDRLTVWLLIAQWDEYACATKTSEQTVLWPLFNRYESDQKGGFRVFPFFWRRWHRTEETISVTHYSPLHYTTAIGENYSTMSWIFYASRDKTDETWGIWALMHFSKKHDATGVTNYVIPVYYSRETTKKGHDTLASLLGLFWVCNEISENKQFTGIYTPLLLALSYPDGDSYFLSWVFYRAQTGHADTMGIPLLFHRRVLHNQTYSNFLLFPFYQSRQTYALSSAETITWFFPIFHHRSDKTQSRFISLFYYRTFSDQGLNWGLPLVFGYTNESDVFTWHFALVTGYKHERAGYVRHHVLPLWWHSRDSTGSDLHLPFLLSTFQNHENGNQVFRAIILGMVYYQNSNFAEYDQTLGVLLGSLYYHNKTAERHFDSYGSLWGGLWHYETEDGYKRFSLLTFVYARTVKDESVRHKVFGIPLN